MNFGIWVMVDGERPGKEVNRVFKAGLGMRKYNRKQYAEQLTLKLIAYHLFEAPHLIVIERVPYRLFTLHCQSYAPEVLYFLRYLSRLEVIKSRTQIQNPTRV